MGEYTDVASNFVKSITKLASLTNTAEMLTNLRELGLKEGWLSTERTKEFSDIITNKPKLDKKGKPKTTVSEKFKPLEGLYSTPEIAAQFNNMQQNKTMTTFTRNITYSGILKVEEKVVYTPVEGNPVSTCCVVQATVKSGVRFWSHPLEMFGIERFKKSAVDAQNALKYAISEYRDRFLHMHSSVSS